MPARSTWPATQRPHSSDPCRRALCIRPHVSVECVRSARRSPSLSRDHTPFVHVFPTCLPHMSSPHVFLTQTLRHRAPPSVVPSAAPPVVRIARAPGSALCECSRQRPVRVLTTAPLCECSRQRPVVRIAPTASAHDSALVRVLTAAPLDGGVSARRRARHGRRVTRRRVRHSRSSVADAICCGSRDRCAQGVCERSRSTDCHAAPRRK